MAVSITCRSVVQRGNKWYVSFSDKTELEFESAQQARDYCRDVLEDVRVKDVLRALMLAKAIRPGASGNAVTSLPGAVATLDLTLANVVRVV